MERENLLHNAAIAWKRRNEKAGEDAKNWLAKNKKLLGHYTREDFAFAAFCDGRGASGNKDFPPPEEIQNYKETYPDFTNDERNAILITLGYERGISTQVDSPSFPINDMVFTSILGKLGVQNPEQYLIVDKFNK